MGLRHVSHLGTWGNQSLCSEILQTFWKHLPSDLEVPLDHGTRQEQGPAAEPGMALSHASLKPAGAGALTAQQGLGQGRRVQLREDFA